MFFLSKENFTGSFFLKTSFQEVMSPNGQGGNTHGEVLELCSNVEIPGVVKA